MLGKNLKWIDSLISPEREISQETLGTDIRNNNSGIIIETTLIWGEGVNT